MARLRASLPNPEHAARDAVESHWAVRAHPVAMRHHARSAADRAWGHVAGRDDEGSRRLTKAEAAEIGTIAEAYERAAVDALQAVTREGVPDSGHARDMLRHAANEVFRLLRVLPVDSAPASRGWHVLRVATFASLAGADRELDEWVAYTRPLLAPHALVHAPRALLDERPWDDVLRRTLAQHWLDLLHRPDAETAERLFEEMGRLRELRAECEARQLSELSATDAAHLHLALAALYGVADAASTLIAHVRRTSRDDTPALLARAFDGARAATPPTGALGRLLPWLHVAAVTIARRQSAQMSLPGLLA